MAVFLSPLRFYLLCAFILTPILLLPSLCLNAVKMDRLCETKEKPGGIICSARVFWATKRFVIRALFLII